MGLADTAIINPGGIENKPAIISGSLFSQQLTDAEVRNLFNPPGPQYVPPAKQSYTIIIIIAIVAIALLAWWWFKKKKK